MHVRVLESHVIGPDAKHTDLIRVEVKLAPQPDAHWAQVFGGPGKGMPPDYPHPLQMPHPDLTGARVIVRVRDDQITESLAKLDERVAATNAFYASEIEPRIVEAERRQTEAQATMAERIERARRIVGQRPENQEGHGG